jgi:hypothetical protein
MASSGDEFDALPDEFEGLDWNEFPELTFPHPNDSCLTPNVNPDPSRPPSSRSSSHFSSDDVYDEAFFAELDALEEIAIRNPAPVNGV